MIKVRPMLAQAEARNRHPAVSYQVCGVEDYPYPENRWDVVASNLVLHYIERLDPVYRLVWRTLVPGGIFLFNIEHPVFTAGVGQIGSTMKPGSPVTGRWTITFCPGPRDTRFLGCAVTKQHHTLTEILMGLLDAGFILKAVEEAKPPAEMLDMPGMKDELRPPHDAAGESRKTPTFRRGWQTVMHQVKITVLKTTFDQALAEEYGAPGIGPCPMLKAGQVFYADYAKPQGLCDEAWKAIYQYVFALAHGAGSSTTETGSTSPAWPSAAATTACGR